MGHCCTPIKVPKVANFHINHTDSQLEVVLTNGQTFSVSKAELEEFLGGNGVSDVIVEGGELKVVSADGTKKTVALPTATTTTSGTIRIATQAEAKAGTDNTSAMTPATTKAVVDDAFGSDSNNATTTKSCTVKLGNRALANDGRTVLGYFVNT